MAEALSGSEFPLGECAGIRVIISRDRKLEGLFNLRHEREVCPSWKVGSLSEPSILGIEHGPDRDADSGHSAVVLVSLREALPAGNDLFDCLLRAVVGIGFESRLLKNSSLRATD